MKFSSVCYWHYYYYYYFFFLKSMRHLLKTNTNKTLKNLRSWDSEDFFWIFTEISKCEQLYLLFTSIRISVFMLVWKSPRCSLRKYIVLCTHIIVIKCYSFSFLASTYCTKALLICLENGFPHSIPSIFYISRSRVTRTSPFWSYKDLNFEKSSETRQF